MREKPEEDQIYHIFNRGVEKRSIFNNDNDRRRFLSYLYFFNDSQAATNISRLCDIQFQTEDSRKKLVEIFAFVLMDNHFHLLVRPIVENGLSEFMQKLGVGYTKYFNIKYERVGPLFQGKYKFVQIESDEQLSYIPHYIHLNPVEIIEPGWKERELRDCEKAFEFAKTYPWSSLGDYLGDEHFSPILDRDLLNEELGGSQEYRQDIVEWLQSAGPSLATFDSDDKFIL
ncbi:MAG: hypothetical protein COX02_01295 [Candidatus Vogelbacteria bacterium CG22_combo_CG10-13_8_21_14_all_37_9]|uniref:Transposase IS200-like domain-containing protein n=1 Tax=Candidatus Vogelbacteria bacterium CG22_combo_CG10-13_8_21_14_all_37_9 TaxID=1975046 RepID=A0A2H0BMI0_9BACT|nr:MAG: hypothetical protein BK005_01460 [bacterium CG10_37_50]PIP58230.1 MAG: hypothetical protein COX02_01295 [Candidatus Vogelbacteria bacterium CG22_combo_CG10-13_8_21_14_all_37_9]